MKKEDKVMLSSEKQEEEKLVAYDAGEIAFTDFYYTPQANFPECPYEGFEDLKTEWLRGMNDAVAEVEDIKVCTYCGSKDIWYCEKELWRDMNTHEFSILELNAYPRTECRNCGDDYAYTDLSQYIYDLQPNE